MGSTNPSSGLAVRLDSILPQTQCRRCGYDGCRPYAEAIVGGAAINRCPPGGDELIATIALITGRPPIGLDRTCGEPGRLTIARIDEASCIGCTLCIDACPVDAIVGAAKRMHTVLSALCTGCALCVPPCPVDCIEMVELEALAERGNRHASALADQSAEDIAAIARSRYQFHELRLEHEANEREQRRATKAEAKLAHLEPLTVGHDLERKKAAVRAAKERARARLAGRG